MNKKMLIAALIIGGLALTGCSSAKTAEPAAAESTATAPAAATTVVPDVVGQQGDAAKASIEAVGLKVDWSETVLVAKNWTVDSQVPAAGSTAVSGAKILLTVSKPTATPDPVESDAPAAPVPAAPSADTTPSGLDVGWAITTCDKYGDSQSPYGWNADFILDGTSQLQGDSWFLKAGVTIKNAAGVKGRFTVECTVSGTNTSPSVDSFNVY